MPKAQLNQLLAWQAIANQLLYQSLIMFLCNFHENSYRKLDKLYKDLQVLLIYLFLKNLKYLINALYQSVPVIATGWSHKYEALMNEYSLGDYLISDYQTQLVIQMMNNIFDKSIKGRMGVKLPVSEVPYLELSKNISIF